MSKPYRATSGRLYAIAFRLLRDRALAEEVLQEAFVNVWHHAGSYATSKSQPLTWLASIVRNRSLDMLRRRELETVPITRDNPDGEADTDMEFASDALSPVDMLLQAADSRDVRQCVDALEGGQKQAIALAFYQGLSHAELAAHLRQPLGTIKSWVRRGLERLRQCLDRAGFVH